MVPSRTYQLNDILHAGWRHRYLIAASFLLVSAAVALVGYWLPDRYRAETTILVAAPRIPDNYVRPTIVPQAPPPATPTPEEAKSIAEQLLPQPRLERVVREFGLYADGNVTMKQRVNRLRDEVELKTVRPDTIRLGYASTDRYLALRVTRRLAGLLIEDNLRERETLSQQAAEFLRNQLADARSKLDAANARIAEYQRRNAGELPSDQSASEQGFQSLELQAQTLHDSITRDQARLFSLERAEQTLAAETKAMEDAIVPAPVDENGNSTAWQAASQLETAKAELRTMEARLTPEHPDIIRQKRLISDLEGKAQAEAQQRARGAGPRHVSTSAEADARRRLVEMQSEIAALKTQLPARQAEEVRLRATSETYRRRLEAIPSHESDLEALKRDRDNLQQTYAALLAKQQESSVAANVERWQSGDRFKVVEAAQLPRVPSSPNRLLIDVFGLLLGLAVGIGLAAIAEYRDTTLRSEEEISACLGLPVLAAIPTANASAAHAAEASTSRVGHGLGNLDVRRQPDPGGRVTS